VKINKKRAMLGSEENKRAINKLNSTLEHEAQLRKVMIRREGTGRAIYAESNVCVVCCLAIFPLCAPAQAKYEVATIMDVNVHKDPPSDVVRYDVSVKVGKTTYVVLFTPPLGENDVKYVAGRELLVLVGKKTIAYNDMLGLSLEVPILSQRSAGKETK
jgi:hypothetical protein